MNPQKWYARGKLLITGEYLVMNGAKALALPLTMGQGMTVRSMAEKLIRWTASRPEGPWFSAVLSLPDLKLLDTDHPELGAHLASILSTVAEMNPRFFEKENGFEVQTQLDFNPEFGFGSSSTFISNLASWIKVDPFELQKKTFGGSGYDIACATSNGAIFYQLDQGNPVVTLADFSPPFSDHIYFVYLGMKRRSKEAITDFKKSALFSEEDIERISLISEEINRTRSLDEFESLVEEHEKIMSYILKSPTVKSLYFQDLDGIAKSLGAWGGDFVLLTTKMPFDQLKVYLSSKGFNVFFAYRHLVFSS